MLVGPEGFEPGTSRAAEYFSASPTLMGGMALQLISIATKLDSPAGFIHQADTAYQTSAEQPLLQDLNVQDLNACLCGRLAFRKQRCDHDEVPDDDSGEHHVRPVERLPLPRNRTANRKQQHQLMMAIAWLK